MKLTNKFLTIALAIILPANFILCLVMGNVAAAIGWVVACIIFLNVVALEKRIKRYEED